jgi:hypothetical protein
MNQPRPHYEPPQTRSAPKFRELAICTALVLIVGGMVAPLVQSAMTKRLSQLCLTHGRQLGMGVHLYAQDYDNHLPLAETWYVLTSPYLAKNPPICTALSQNQGVGYAMDSRLSGKSLDNIGADHGERVLLYESFNLSPNAHDPGTSFDARHQVDKPQSPKYGWVGYVDGHGYFYQEKHAKDGVRQGIIRD